MWGLSTVAQPRLAPHTNESYNGEVGLELDSPEVGLKQGSEWKWFIWRVIAGHARRGVRAGKGRQPSQYGM